MFVFKAATDCEQRSVGLDRVGRVDPVALMEAVDDLLSSHVTGDDILELVGKEQPQDRVSEQCGSRRTWFRLTMKRTSHGSLRRAFCLVTALP